MNEDVLTKLISACINDVVFDYNGKQCGITSEVHEYVPIFQVWCGKNTKEYDKVDDVIKDRFFDGMALTELLCGSNPIEFSVL